MADSGCSDLTELAPVAGLREVVAKNLVSTDDGDV